MEPTKEKFSPEELKKMRSGMITSYKAEIELLKVQSDYEKLMADIEEHRLRRYFAILKFAQLNAPEEENKETKVKKPKLKKDE